MNIWGRFRCSHAATEEGPDRATPSKGFAINPARSLDAPWKVGYISRFVSQSDRSDGGVGPDGGDSALEAPKLWSPGGHGNFEFRVERSDGGAVGRLADTSNLARHP